METPNNTNKDKKRQYSKVIVILVIALNIIFTIATFTIIILGFEVPDALIISWFAFTGTELLALATIKNTETKYVDVLAEDSNEEEESEESDE